MRKNTFHRLTFWIIKNKGRIFIPATPKNRYIMAPSSPK
ncbi:hypothetical protein C943_00824 [Mariniradius saccharolyticus AK6]|uniref:Uncharacterized protein n=1 Tax=Mariniradius saccharolyticus AK6 TaxID=1239962 RepID=M7XE52_9BACT|nr:hypothetical protein C943_00824 [Mariniradius saccharolyticus AK6]